MADQEGTGPPATLGRVGAATSGLCRRLQVVVHDADRDSSS